MNKQVIFVGGTAYSGSTFFHMILANDPAGFACGEVQWVFNPRNDNHANLLCTCNNPDCQVWSTVRANGEENLYQTIFEQFPQTKLIVTSSKSPFWIMKQNELLKRQGIEPKNIVIWKTPLEFAQSANRRGQFDIWERSWVNYYRLYASLMSEWRAVKYANIVHDADRTLQEVCQYLDIPYFAEKQNYWDKAHHVLSGNSSARLHLLKNEQAQELVEGYDKERIKFYRSIYYREAKEEHVLEAVAQAKKNNPYFDKVEAMLVANDVTNAEMDHKAVHSVTMNLPMVKMRLVKDTAVTMLGKIRYKEVLSG